MRKSCQMLTRKGLARFVENNALAGFDLDVCNTEAKQYCLNKFKSAHNSDRTKEAAATCRRRHIYRTAAKCSMAEQWLTRDLTCNKKQKTSFGISLSLPAAFRMLHMNDCIETSVAMYRDRGAGAEEVPPNFPPWEALSGTTPRKK